MSKVFSIGDILDLKGLSSKGKNRIRELGNIWQIVEITNEVLFTTNKGPWLLICPKNEKFKDSIRWIHAESDKDFSFISKKG